SVTFPEFELALKEFVINYQHRTILSDALLVEKAKILADRLGVPEGALQFSPGWLYKFKTRNGIRQQKLHGEAASADETAISDALPLLHDKCGRYPPERIYNMDETGLFYRYGLSFRALSFIVQFACRLEPDRTLATKRISGRKQNRERLSIALCASADGLHKL